MTILERYPGEKCPELCGALGSRILRVVKQFHPHSITVTDIDEAKLQEAFDFVTSHDPSYRKGVLTFGK